jgi:hypothetical protein
VLAAHTHERQHPVQPQQPQCVCGAWARHPTDCIAGGVFWQDINDLISEINPNSKGSFSLPDFLVYVNRLRILYDGTGYTLALNDQGTLFAKETDEVGTHLDQLTSIEDVGDRLVPSMNRQLK